MEKLHPRSVWMFFFRCLLVYLWLAVFFSFMIVVIIMNGVQDKEVEIEGGFQRVIDFEGFWWWAVLIFIGLMILSYIWARLSYHFWRYELTENAYKAERGIIWKRYVSIPYERIQNVDIYRGLVARILGLSDIHIQTAGFSAGGKRGWAEGRLPGLDKEKAEEIREELIGRVKGIKEQGL